jgi:hypothetical protein
MSLKLNLGLSKKIGQPDYGSIGASCHVEFEADSSLLQHDLEGFQERARQAFTACRQAVNDELARHRENGSGRSAVNGTTTAANGRGRNATATNGDAANGRRAGSLAHRASAKQLSYLEQLTTQIRGLDAARLEALTKQIFGKQVADLSSLDASTLIDTLKQVKAGVINLDSVGKGAAA